MGESRFRFRLRDLMVTMAIVTIVMAILIQAINATRVASRRVQCSNNMKHIALSLQTFAGENNSFFPDGTVPNVGLPPEKRLSWYVQTMPFVEQGLSWGGMFDERFAWDAAVNRPPKLLTQYTDKSGQVVRVIPPQERTHVGFLMCPSGSAEHDPSMVNPTHYIGIAGLGENAPRLPKGDPNAGIFGYGRPTQFADIKDGQFATMVLAETALSNGPWTAGGPATVRGLDPGRRPYIGRGRQFGGLHPGGANVAFVDGSVRFLRDSIDPKVFEAIATMAGGEPVNVGGLEK